MLNCFFRKKQAVLGVDISSTSVKIIELQPVGNSYRVERYAVVALPQETIVKKAIKDENALVSSIRKVIQLSKTTVQQATIAIADSSVITKTLTMDAGFSNDDIEQHIMIAADKYIPYPLEDISLDFTICEPLENNPDRIKVHVVACHNKHLHTWTQAIARAGLTTHAVNIHSHATERAVNLTAPSLPKQSRPKTIAILDIGATSTHLTVLHNMRAIFSHEEALGGLQLTHSIQNHYGISEREANIGKQQGSLPSDYETKILTPFKTLAVTHARRALHCFSCAHQHTTVHHILLTGGTANIPGLAKHFTEHLGIPTQILNPFTQMHIAPQLDKRALARDASGLMLCCGLALCNFKSRGAHDDRH